ncbi:dienelactone hydrolase family protein [Herbiconiux moechotypicola]|uniref:Dienelactone hydrolase family protein n=1 Tax=Herbiconiux moechotypicola TaxID=637393 RepID=A0ABN3DFL7_9MICO|nr:dienelactone hydrolase family protein [Herbiconiux moechotypicola]MCS5729356.1 dienelactone hydrolase family protein [Herbiconiux moechotypicola]
MANLTARDVEYHHDDTRMLGWFVAPASSASLPCVVLLHDAFGLTDELMATAERLATRGLAVFAADVWGGRARPETPEEIGAFIGGMAGDRESWLGRIDAAHRAAGAQPEVDASALASMGYCFGGSSALEHLRTGGVVRGVVSIHPGLDLLETGWDEPVASARVLLCAGADDPMATAPMRAGLEASLTAAGLDWELDLYGHTKHAFTNPASDLSPMRDVVAYNPRSAERAWASATCFLDDLFPLTKETTHA